MSLTHVSVKADVGDFFPPIPLKIKLSVVDLPGA
jgi:hypothetical protein